MIGRINWHTTPQHFRRESAERWARETTPGSQWRARESSKRFRRTSERHTVVWACHMAGRGEMQAAREGVE